MGTLGRLALTATGLVAACALGVLALDQPAAAAHDDHVRSNCCAFPDEDIRDPSGFTLRLPRGWRARADGAGGIVVDGDQGEQLWIVAPAADGTPGDAARALRDGIDPRSTWIKTIAALPPEQPGLVTYVFRAQREHVPSLVRRFDTILRSVRDTRGRSLVPPFGFQALVP